MVEPVDPTTRPTPTSMSSSMSYPWSRTPSTPAEKPAETPAETPAPASSLDVQIVRRDAQAGEMGINVVRVLNPGTGEPIYQSPPEGVLVMLESALWRLRKKDTDD